MNRKIKKALKEAFNAPKPKRKTEFLMSLAYPRANRLNFISTQVGYIRKRVWIISFLAVASVLLGLRYQEDMSMVQWVAAFLPFFVLLGITEIAKSMSCNMAELEMSCRYSLLDITLARLGIMGAVNTAVFIIITAFMSRGSEIGIFTFTAQMFSPYLLTCSLSLFALNRFRGKERLYICGGASCLVSVASTVIFSPLYSDYMGGNWLFWVFAVLLIWTGAEVIKFIKKMEDYQWNLSLTV